MSSLSLLFCCFLAVSTALAQCPAPTITSPTDNQNVDGTYGAARFTGTVPTPRDSSCTQIRFYRATDNFLLSVLDAGSTAATFDRTIGGLMPGQLSVYALTTGQNGLTPSTRSNTVTFNIEQGCSQPVIQTPANNAVLSTRRFSISGTTICPYINAYINNQLVGSTIASSSGVYQLSSGNALPDGDYLLRIVAYRSLAGPTTQSAESQFSVASTEPYSTVSQCFGVCLYTGRTVQAKKINGKGRLRCQRGSMLHQV